MDISEIKTFMKVRGITQKDLSQMANIPLQTIRKIFAGYTSHPRIDTMQAIEKALGLNSAQSYANDGLKPESTAKSLSEKETRLLDAFNGLIPPMQDYILDMVEKLVAQPQNANKRA